MSCQRSELARLTNTSTTCTKGKPWKKGHVQKDRKTKVDIYPLAIQGAIFHESKYSGKFHGEMRMATPAGVSVV